MNHKIMNVFKLLRKLLSTCLVCRYENQNIQALIIRFSRSHMVTVFALYFFSRISKRVTWKLYKLFFFMKKRQAWNVEATFSIISCGIFTSTEKGSTCFGKLESLTLNILFSNENIIRAWNCVLLKVNELNIIKLFLNYVLFSSFEFLIYTVEYHIIFWNYIIFKF